MNASTYSRDAEEAVWRFDDGGLLAGPYSEIELAQLAASKYITPETELLHDNGGRTTAAQIGLFFAKSASPGDGEPLWRYERDGQQVGPFSCAELRRLVNVGLITPETMLVRDGDRASAAEVLQNGERGAQPSRAPATDAMGGRSGASEGTSHEKTLNWLAVLPFLLIPLYLVVLVIVGSAGADAARVSSTLDSLYQLGLLLAAPIWIFIGARAVVRGVIFDFAGRPHRRPVLFRLAGVAVAAFGCALLISSGFGVAALL